MGLDVSHGAFNGTYSGFACWRRWLAKKIGMPPLDMMEGFGGEEQIRWDILKPHPLHEVLSHSDCDGDIPWGRCLAIAEKLTEVLEQVAKEDAQAPFASRGNDMKEITNQFRDGCLAAYNAQENLEFH